MTASLARPLNECLPLEARLRGLRDALLHGLVERDVAVRLALIAALAGEHLLLLGPPGTAKSLVARRLRHAFAGSTYFERLLTRFTVPEELFGPLSIKGLEDDRYERLTDAYLPAAAIAFLDEIFKANSAILNALLTLLNERQFDNGTKRVDTPLIAVIGASNEFPEGEELDALFDRFLMRLHVGPVSKAAFPALIGLRGHAEPAIPPEFLLTPADLAHVQAEAEKVDVPADVQSLLGELRDWCTAEEIPVSDRRWRKVVKLLQVSAFTNGRGAVSIWDCWLLQHCLWNEPEDGVKVYQWYASRVGAAAAMDPARLTRMVVAWEGQLSADQESRSQMRDAEGRPLFKGPDGKPTVAARANVQSTRHGELLYLAPPKSFDGNGYEVADRTRAGAGFTRTELNSLRVRDGSGSRHYFHQWPDHDAYLVDVNNWVVVDSELPALIEPTRQKDLYVEASLRDIDAIRRDVEHYKSQLAAHTASLQAEITGHLWVTSDFAAPASASLGETAHEVLTLLARLEKVRKGFELLPRELGSSAPAPATAAKPARRKVGPHGSGV